MRSSSEMITWMSSRPLLLLWPLLCHSKLSKIRWDALVNIMWILNTCFSGEVAWSGRKVEPIIYERSMFFCSLDGRHRAFNFWKAIFHDDDGLVPTIRLRKWPPDIHGDQYETPTIWQQFKMFLVDIRRPSCPCFGASFFLSRVCVVRHVRPLRMRPHHFINMSGSRIPCHHFVVGQRWIVSTWVFATNFWRVPSRCENRTKKPSLSKNFALTEVPTVPVTFTEKGSVSW